MRAESSLSTEDRRSPSAASAAAAADRNPPACAAKDDAAADAEPARDFSKSHGGSDLGQDVSLHDQETEEAATKIQRWWRTAESKELSLKQVFDTFEAEGLSSEWAKSVSFEELALCLQREELLHATSSLLFRLTNDERRPSTTEEEDDEEDEDSRAMMNAEPARILLSAFVVSSHPEVVFAEAHLRSGTRQEQNLRASSNIFIASLEGLAEAVREDREEQYEMVERFERVWADYQKRFAAWKQSSASFLTDELVAAYLEIEAAKISADGGSGAIESTLASIPGLADSDDLLEERSALEAEEAAMAAEDEMDDIDDRDRLGDRASVSELEARQRTIRNEIVRLGGTSAELRLQQALDQYSSSQQAANAQLAHEIILNPDLQLLPARDPDMLRVRGIATRAFWSSVRAEIRAAGRLGGSPADLGGETRYGRVLSLLTEVRDGLLGLTTNAQFSDEVCSALDIAFLSQQMEHNTLSNEDVVKLLQFVVEKIIELDAPAYEDDSRAWLAGLIDSMNDAATPQGHEQPVGDFADFLVEVFAWLFAKLEQIRVGVANFHLRSLSAVLRSHGVEYERAAFVRQVGRGEQRLEKTLSWLKDQLRTETVGDPDKLDRLHRADIKMVESIPKLGVLTLCLSPTALSYESCPESLRMDLTRLLGFQNEAQRLAVVAATIVVLQQVLRKHGLADDLGSVDDDDASGSLPDTLYISLQRPEIRLPALIDHVVRVADSHVRHMRLLRKARGEPNAGASLNAPELRKMLEVIVCPNNAVFMLVTKRIGVAIRGFLVDRVLPEAGLRSLGGLTPVIPRVRQLAVNIASLADHNYRVHSARYGQVVQHIVRDLVTDQRRR